MTVQCSISRTLVLALLSFLVGPAGLCAQRASLVGTVIDPQGAVVPHATVRLQGVSPSSAKQTASDAAGYFKFESVEPGIYQLASEAPGFQAITQKTAIIGASTTTVDLQFQKLSAIGEITVVVTGPDALTPDPSHRVFVHDQLLAANPGRPGAPVSVPGLPVESASGGIKAPQYFAPGVAGDHGEPIAQFFQVGNFLLPNNLPANAHGNGYADPNLLIPNGIAFVEADAGAFNVREGNHSVNLAVTYGLRDRLSPFTQLTADLHDVDLVTGWSPSNPAILGWLSVQTSFGNGFLDRPEHRRQYQLNAYRTLKTGVHEVTVFGSGYYGFSFMPGLVPTAVPVAGDTIDSRQQDKTLNSLLVATDTWQASSNQHIELSGFFRTYSLDLRSNFGDGLIRQSEFRTVTGGNVTYLLNDRERFAFLAGLDLRRDAPRNLDLEHAEENGVFQPITSNNLTLGFFTPFVSVDGALSQYFHYDLGLRHEEVSVDNIDKMFRTNSFHKLAGITLPKGTFTFLPPKPTFLPTVAFSFGEAFHTNDPRMGTSPGVSTGSATLIAPSHSAQLVVSKSIERTDFSLTLARVSNAQQLAKIDPDTGLLEDIGASRTRSVTLSARRYFSTGSLQVSWAGATATNRLTGEDIPEAPRRIWDVVGTLNRLPFGLRARTEYESVGSKPLGDGFVASPVREFRLSLLHSFLDGKIDLGVNSMIAHGYTGQTLETLALRNENARLPFDRVVGVPLKSHVSLSWVYKFGY